MDLPPPVHFTYFVSRIGCLTDLGVDNRAGLKPEGKHFVRMRRGEKGPQLSSLAVEAGYGKAKWGRCGLSFASPSPGERVRGNLDAKSLVGRRIFSIMMKYLQHDADNGACLQALTSSLRSIDVSL